MFKNIIPLCVILIIITINRVVASPISGIEAEILRKSKQDDMLIQQRLNDIELQKSVIDAENFKKNSENITNTTINNEERINKNSEDNCIKFENIDIINEDKNLKTKKIKKTILNQYKNSCLSKVDIEFIRNKINQYYVKKGYITTLIAIDIEKLMKNKELIFIVKENNVNDIEIKNDKFSKLKTYFLFPFVKNKPLNLRDLEQGLEQINRLNSNNAKFDIVDDKVIINNQKSKSFDINLSYDNSGSKSIGTDQFGGSLNFDNILNINDNLYLNYTDSITNHDKEYSKSLYASYSIPFGYWTYTTSYSNSKYMDTMNGTTGIDFAYKGDTDTYSNSIDRVLYRNNFYKLNSTFELETVDKMTKIRDTKINNSSYKISNVKLSFNNVFNLNNAILIIKPTFQKGINGFESKRDITNSNNGLAKNDYLLYKLFIYYNKYIQSLGVSYTFQLNSQWTDKTMYSNNQISIGGEGTIRSYKDTSISGDRGFYIKNELSINTSNIPYLNKLNYKNILNKTKLSVFADYGLVSEVYNDPYDVYNSRSGQLLGIGTSLKYNGEYSNFSITYAKGVYASDYIADKYNGDKYEDTVWVRVGLSY